MKRHVDGRFPALRTNLSKLGKATEQFTMLLHVSSFAPSVTSTNGRNFSPVILGSTPPQTNLLATVADDKLVSTGLSRSRSAQAAASAKVTPMPLPRMRRAVRCHHSSHLIFLIGGYETALRLMILVDVSYCYHRLHYCIRSLCFGILLSCLYITLISSSALVRVCLVVNFTDFFAYEICH